MILGAASALPAFLLDWFAVRRNWSRAKYITKPLALAVLIAWFGFANLIHLNKTGDWVLVWWFLAGQVLSLAGDIFLLMPGRMFMAGLLAFLAAHACYIVSLHALERWPQSFFYIFVVIVVVLSTAFFRLLYRHLVVAQRSRRLWGPVAVYVVAVSLMLLSALSTLFRPDWSLLSALLTASGGVLFYASDALLAYNKFVCPVCQASLKVRVLYHLGQLALAVGITLHIGVVSG